MGIGGAFYGMEISWTQPLSQRHPEPMMDSEDTSQVTTPWKENSDEMKDTSPPETQESPHDMSHEIQEASQYEKEAHSELVTFTKVPIREPKYNLRRKERKNKNPGPEKKRRRSKSISKAKGRRKPDMPPPDIESSPVDLDDALVHAHNQLTNVYAEAVLCELERDVRTLDLCLGESQVSQLLSVVVIEHTPNDIDEQMVFFFPFA